MNKKCNKQQESELEAAQEMRCSIGFVYLFSYYLLQFCGHTWIFSNMTARFLSFGLVTGCLKCIKKARNATNKLLTRRTCSLKSIPGDDFMQLDALAGTFYFVGVMMSLCQLLSVLELFHIADGIEECRLLPRLVQVIERNFLLFLIISQEEFQSKTVVCVLFYLWNILQLIRYPYQLMCLISTPSFNMLWAHYTIAIPVYVLSVITEGVSIIQALPYYESQGTYSVQLETPVSVYVHFPYLLMAYLPLLAAGSALTVRILLGERSQSLDSWNQKMKRD